MPENDVIVKTKVIRTFKDLTVYQEGFRLAMSVFQATRGFPKEELYALSNQMRNASRSVPANIAEGWAKRKHVAIFRRQLLDAMGSVSEMFVWLDMAESCGYLTQDVHKTLYEAYESLGRRLHQLTTTWQTFK